MEMHRCTSQKWRRMQMLGNYRRRVKDVVNSRRMGMDTMGGVRGRCLETIHRVIRLYIRNSTGTNDTKKRRTQGYKPANRDILTDTKGST